MIFGVDYYPEHWNRDEWESQAKLMQKGGFYTVFCKYLYCVIKE